jgi:hypothetical protein
MAGTGRIASAQSMTRTETEDNNESRRVELTRELSLAAHPTWAALVLRRLGPGRGERGRRGCSSFPARIAYSLKLKTAPTSPTILDGLLANRK